MTFKCMRCQHEFEDKPRPTANAAGEYMGDLWGHTECPRCGSIYMMQCAITTTTVVKEKWTMVTTIGRIVHYRLRHDQADEINRRRKHAADNYHLHAHQKLGVQLHTGNMMKRGQVVPMLIVQVWGEQPTSCVNGVAFPDGSDPYWVTSVACGEREGEFTWPVPQQTVAAEGE